MDSDKTTDTGELPKEIETPTSTKKADEQGSTSTPNFGILKKTVRVPKLNALKEKASEPVKAVEHESTTTLSEPEPAEDLPVEIKKLHEVWSNLARKKKDDGKDQLFMLMSQPYEFAENIVTLTVTSPLQEDLINEYRPEIVQYLRKELRNKMVGIATKLVKPDTKKMIYTPHEKFNFLAEKHPALLILKDKLGLDPDF